MKVNKFATTFFALIAVTTLSAYYDYPAYNYSDCNLNRQRPLDAFIENPNFQYTPGVRGPTATSTFIPSPNQDNILRGNVNFQNQGFYPNRYTENKDHRFQNSYRNFPNRYNEVNQNRNLQNLDQDESYQYRNHANEWADTNYADTSTTSNIVEARVHTALQKDSSISQQAKNIAVAETDGNVTLTGNVPTKAEKDKVIVIIKNVDGVKSVIDRITIAQ